MTYQPKSYRNFLVGSGSVESFFSKQMKELEIEQQEAKQQYERISKEIQEGHERMKNKEHRLLRKLKSNCVN
ncbi:hypothetical protein V1503_02510 [Bacillus sp. SCS-151]|uniref:hypothetical protein n=1 Tax=Nanhaiella sioensis TaxID=3115293 RepID=UPI00397D8A1A